MSKLPIQRKNGKKIASRTSTKTKTKTKLPLQVLFADRDFRGEGGGTGGRSIRSWTIGNRQMWSGLSQITFSYCGNFLVSGNSNNGRVKGTKVKIIVGSLRPGQFL